MKWRSDNDWPDDVTRSRDVRKQVRVVGGRGAFELPRQGKRAAVALAGTEADGVFELASDLAEELETSSLRNRRLARSVLFSGRLAS